MFRFEEPAYLYLLLLLPLLAAFYLYSNYRRRKAIRKFGDPILMAQLMPEHSTCFFIGGFVRMPIVQIANSNIERP